VAGDWIKFRSELWTHPKFIALVNGLLNDHEGHGLHSYACGDLGLDVYPRSQKDVTELALQRVTDSALREVTMAALLRVWCMVNSHCKVDDQDAICAPMSLSNLDGIAGFTGFGYALEAVGWVSWDDDKDTLRFKNFLEFNEPACLRKIPALTNAERQARYREKHRVTESNESNAREEKRREEKKNNKNIVGQRPDVMKVLMFLNEKTGRNYKPVPANLELIAARLKEGASVDDCRAVIAKKCREWSGDEKMYEYLRPATLFNRTKFAQYQGEVGAPEHQPAVAMP
jgi:uncharacterized phage protein (TIGR02220 family)